MGVNRSDDAQEVRRILIVDDEAMNRELYSAIFREEGFFVDTAANRAEAYECIGRHHPDLILLDIRLGNESGLDILREIKEDDALRFIYVVMVTSHLKTSDDQARGLELGADGYLTRPIERRELVARVSAFLRHKGTIDRLRRSESQFRRIIERNPDAMLVVDTDGHIRFANPASEDVFHLTMDDLLSRIFGYPIVKGEHTEISIVRRDGGDSVAEMRSIDIDWEEKPALLASVRDISHLKRTEEQIRRNLREKEVLIRELYHRTKNNMQVISAMVQMKKYTFEDKAYQDALQDVTDKIMAMALVHQKLYESQDLSSLNLHDYFTDLVALIQQSIISETGGIILRYEGRDLPVLIDTAIPLGLVLNETVTNAAKHGFPGTRTGEIAVSLSLDDDDALRLVIADNGIGLPESFSVESDARLGLKTVLALVEKQLDGRIEINGHDGVRYEITIPAEIYQARV